MIVTPLQCSPIDPAVMCAERWISSRNGSFYYDEKRKGYSCSLLTGAFGLPIILDACPFCRNLLPGHHARRAFEKLTELPPGLGAGDATCYDEGEE